MSHSDIVLTIVGILLIIAGLVFFISGKLAGSQNKVEAFGIKMDVNNPSLVLVIFGVLLLLAPRLMPEKENGDLAISPSQSNNSAGEQVTTTNSKATTADKITAPKSPQNIPAPHKPAITHSPFPSLPGTYQLLSYQEDGVPINANGQLSITNFQNNVFPFAANLEVYSVYGERLIFQYKGHFSNKAGQWFLKINSANDPEWVDLGEVKMMMLLDGNFIGMHYYYDGDIATIWQG